MTTTRVTREELYDLVWTTPMRKLALRYGLSDVALAKTCRRLGIPTPGRGYWAKLAARVKVKHVPLPKAGPRIPEGVTFAVVENPVPRPPPVKAPEVVVPASLSGACEVVQGLGKMLQHARVDEFERMHVGDAEMPILSVTVAHHRRALLLLDALCRTMVQRGHVARFGRDSHGGATKDVLVLGVREVDLAVSLVEVLDRRSRPLTPEEQHRSDFRVQLGGSPIVAKEQFACGRLQLAVYGLGGGRSVWSDARIPLERRLGRIIVDCEAEGDRRREAQEAAQQARLEEERLRREAAEAAERKRVEEQAADRRRYEADLRRQHQRALRHDLRGMTRRWGLATRVRAFLDQIEHAVPAPDRGAGFSTWLAWARSEADRLDPLTAPHAIAKPLEPKVPRPEGQSAPSPFDP